MHVVNFVTLLIRGSGTLRYWPLDDRLQLSTGFHPSYHRELSKHRSEVAAFVMYHGRSEGRCFVLDRRCFIQERPIDRVRAALRLNLEFPEEIAWETGVSVPVVKMLLTRMKTAGEIAERNHA